MTELPLLVVDVQRGGPSTGLPTKTEQADLLQAMFGRNGEAPVPIVAPQSPGRLLRRRRRGGPDRGHLPHPGDAALRRHARQRLRAVADPRGRRPAGDRPRVRHRAQPRPRTRRATPEFWPYLRDRGDPGPAVGDPRHPGPRAPDRRPGEGRRPRQHLLRPRQPRLHGAHPAGQDRPDRRQPAAARGRRPRRARREVLVLGWGSTYGPIGAACRRVRKAGLSRRPGAPAPPQPVPQRPRRDAARGTTR